MKQVKAFCLHGINTGPTEPYLRNWHFPEGWDAYQWRWPSSGTITFDAITSHTQFWPALNEARANYDSLVRDVGLPDIVIAHSMGQVVGFHCPIPIGVPFVSLGGPFHSPVTRRLMKLAGIWREAPEKTTAFYNTDDPVCSLLGRSNPIPKATNIQIAITDQEAKPYFDEHDIRLYQGHPIIRGFYREFQASL